MSSQDKKKSSNKKKDDVSSEFTAYYMQRATKEFAKDLDAVRAADDFKADGLPMVVHALQQGTAMFSAGEQRGVMRAEEAGGAKKEEG